MPSPSKDSEDLPRIRYVPDETGRCPIECGPMKLPVNTPKRSEKAWERLHEPMRPPVSHHNGSESVKSAWLVKSYTRPYVRSKEREADSPQASLLRSQGTEDPPFLPICFQLSNPFRPMIPSNYSAITRTGKFYSSSRCLPQNQRTVPWPDRVPHPFENA